ncbi:MAG: protein-disulfide isomerase [Myxococcota bacterium]|jgi:protein-disulfide isomerase
MTKATQTGRGPFIGLALIALVAGGIVGWLARGDGGAGGASEAACEGYRQQLCARVGDSTKVCRAASTMIQVLTPAACAAAAREMNTSVERAAAVTDPCQELITKLCAAIGPDTESCALVRSQTPAFPDEQCVALLTPSKFDEVAADMLADEAAKKPLEPALWKQLSGGAAPSHGPRDATVTVVEYSDFECPYCVTAAQTLTLLKAQYGEHVRFVFRQLPLPSHPNAQLAAEASLEADAQGKFWEMHDYLFANQERLERPSLEGYAKRLGLDEAAFSRALDDRRHRSVVAADVAMAKRAGALGAPLLFVDGQRIANATDFEAIANAIDAKLRAQGLVSPRPIPE